MSRFEIRKKNAPCKIWGENLDPEALSQMDDACSLPVSVRAALMPDAHKGYGIPIGGVLAVKNAVIPYAVGVDIACRMCMSILDFPCREFKDNRGRFKIALENETRFGMGEAFSPPKMHRVMDEDWNFSNFIASLKDKAWKQLGTSGSGNHFAEFGKLTLALDDLGLKQGEYTALLTHSGSRGTGAEIAVHYSTLARKIHPELPPNLQNLAWLDMDSSEGREYWMAMELMGRYSAANHEIIHGSVLNALGIQPLVTLENHHNFAWRMQCGPREVIVHRKGATPAGKGVIGIIPGSMASPAFVVRGVGNELALDSAAHGAGRKMSRNAAIKQYQWRDLDALLKEKGITLISAGIDEIPMAYKNIEDVMEQQKDLVSIIAEFDPELVKMAPPDRRKTSFKKQKHKRKKNIKNENRKNENRKNENRKNENRKNENRKNENRKNENRKNENTKKRL